MGEMIVGPDWLFLLCYHNRSTHKPARAVYRAFFLLRKRLGHLLDLDGEDTRRTLEWAISRGRVPAAGINCARCGCVAMLPDWVKCADMTEAQRNAIVADNPEHAMAHQLDFLGPCPGGSYKRVVHVANDWPEVL